jgi:hypothetical protein
VPYCNSQHIEKAIAQALSNSSPESLDEPVDLINIGNSLSTNVVPQDVIDQFILWAEEEINSSLNAMYITPLPEVVTFETSLLVNINEYNTYIVTADASPFNVGDSTILKDRLLEERYIIQEIGDTAKRNLFTTTSPITYSFKRGTRVLLVKYPEPITMTAARLAAANIYDRYFASQAAPNESKFGQFLRSLARKDLNMILNGRTELPVHRVGRVFYNPNLAKPYSLRDGKGENDIDDIGRQ